jgi:hypothetical protein
VIDGFVTVLMSACLALLAAALVSSALRRSPGVAHLAVAAAIEIAVVVQVGIALVRLVGGAEVHGVALFLAYAAFCVVVLPIGTLFAIEEKTRWSGVILAVSSLALIITLWRLNGVWTGTDV